MAPEQPMHTMEPVVVTTKKRPNPTPEQISRAKELGLLLAFEAGRWLLKRRDNAPSNPAYQKTPDLYPPGQFPSPGRKDTNIFDPEINTQGIETPDVTTIPAFDASTSVAATKEKPLKRRIGEELAIGLIGFAGQKIFGNQANEVQQEALADLRNQQQMFKRQAQGRFTPGERQDILRNAQPGLDQVSSNLAQRGVDQSGIGARIAADAEQRLFFEAQSRASKGLQTATFNLYKVATQLAMEDQQLGTSLRTLARNVFVSNDDADIPMLEQIVTTLKSLSSMENAQAQITANTEAIAAAIKMFNAGLGNVSPTTKTSPRPRTGAEMMQQVESGTFNYKTGKIE